MKRPQHRNQNPEERARELPPGATLKKGELLELADHAIQWHKRRWILYLDQLDEWRRGDLELRRTFTLTRLQEKAATEWGCRLSWNLAKACIQKLEDAPARELEGPTRKALEDWIDEDEPELESDTCAGELMAYGVSPEDAGHE